MSVSLAEVPGNQARGLPQGARVPAVVCCSGIEPWFEIAAVPVIDRLLVALHRAGAGPITVVSAEKEIPEAGLRRTIALKIPVRFATEIPESPGPTLVAEGNILAHADDVRRCIESRSRLRSSVGEPLGLGLTSLPSQDVEASLKGVPEIAPTKPTYRVRSASDAATAARALWASLSSSSDGLVDRYFNRPVGRHLSKVLVHTAATPNAVSVASILIGVAAAVLFGMGIPGAAITGAILFQLSAIVDCVDGDIARILFKESPLGKWIDLVGDQVVHLSIFAGIALGLWRMGAGSTVLWLGGSALLGAALSFAVVLRGMTTRRDKSRALQRFIDAATSRDFSVVVLLLAFVQKMEWFLWLAATGSHLFWITALLLQLRPRTAPE